MNFGAFAGGFAQGIQQGLSERDQRAEIAQRDELLKQRLEQIRVDNQQQFATKIRDDIGRLAEGLKNLAPDADPELRKQAQDLLDGHIILLNGMAEAGIIPQGAGTTAATIARISPTAAEKAGKVAEAEAQGRAKFAVTTDAFTDLTGNRIVNIIRHDGTKVSTLNLGKTRQSAEFEYSRFRADLALRSLGRDVKNPEIQALSQEEASQALNNLRGPDFLSQLLTAAPGDRKAPPEPDQGGLFKDLLGYFGLSEEKPAETPAAKKPGTPAASEADVQAAIEKLKAGQELTEEETSRLSVEQLDRIIAAVGAP